MIEQLSLYTIPATSPIRGDNAQPFTSKFVAVQARRHAFVTVLCKILAFRSFAEPKINTDLRPLRHSCTVITTGPIIFVHRPQQPLRITCKPYCPRPLLQKSFSKCFSSSFVSTLHGPF